ncbi:hypothetical protein CUPL110328_00705 [Cupriavidus plantarum]|nr:hypothetical protein LMG26296_02919 [Cupriavidus plantarum]SMR85676.1 hypothetical protein SAMN05421735_4484 [Cupriavidus plantarum]
MFEERDCWLYLLMHRSEPFMKIGVANDFHARAVVFAEPVDFTKSFVAAGSREACYRGEKVLHKLSSEAVPRPVREMEEPNGLKNLPERTGRGVAGASLRRVT